MVIFVHSFWRRHQHALEPHYRYFLPSLYFKLFFGLAFGIFYSQFYIGGGDTSAYWNGAVKLNDLFYHSPEDYFAELFTFGETGLMTDHFDKISGYPPQWIYSEPESWMVCKFYSLLIIPGVKGYFALTLITSYLAHMATWKFYEMVRSYKIHKERLLALAVLFIPSVSSWCSGISKDTLLYIALLMFITHFFRILSHYGTKRRSYIGLLFFAFMLITLRPVMFMAVMAPAVFALSARILRTRVDSIMLRFSMQFITSIAVILIAAFIFTNGSLVDSSALKNMITQAAIVQKDFTINKTYGDNRYFLDITDYSMLGMVKALPAAVMAGLYRPFLWEALTPTLIINGVESVVLIWLTIRMFLRKKLRPRLAFIRKHELLVYIFCVMLFIAFFSGFTSVIFGVLVRIRSFALPFLLIVIFADQHVHEKETEEVVR